MTLDIRFSRFANQGVIDFSTAPHVRGRHPDISRTLGTGDTLLFHVLAPIAPI
jgi:hypothetical protein